MGHTLKGIGMSLGISTSLDAVTTRYVDVRLERKKEVLDVYHKEVHNMEKGKQGEEPIKKPKKKSNDISL